jgi:hypothetical protein
MRDSRLARGSLAVTECKPSSPEFAVEHGLPFLVISTAIRRSASSSSPSPPPCAEASSGIRCWGDTPPAESSIAVYAVTIILGSCVVALKYESGATSRVGRSTRRRRCPNGRAPARAEVNTGDLGTADCKRDALRRGATGATPSTRPADRASHPQLGQQRQQSRRIVSLAGRDGR